MQLASDPRKLAMGPGAAEPAWERAEMSLWSPMGLKLRQWKLWQAPSRLAAEGEVE